MSQQLANVQSCALMIVAAFGAVFTTCVAKAQPQDIMVLTLGTKPTPYALDKPYKTVRIADPNIVDVMPETDRMLLLVPKAAGDTNLFFLDSLGNTYKELRVMVTRPPGGPKAENPPRQ